MKAREEKDFFLNIYTGVKDNDKFWCVSRVYSGIYVINLNTFEAEYVCDLPEHNSVDRIAYNQILKHENKLYCIPFMAQQVAIVDLETYKVSTIKLENESMKHAFRVNKGIIFDEWILLCPGGGRCFYRINLHTGRVDSNSFWTNEEERLYAIDCCSDNNSVYVTLAYRDTIVKVDVRNFSFELIDIYNNETGYSSILFHNNSLWIAPFKKGNLVEFNPLEKTIISRKEFPINFKREEFQSFISMIGDDLHIYIIPLYGNMFLDIDMQEGIIKPELFGLSSKQMELMSKGSLATFAMKEEKMYIVLSNGIGLLEYDINQEKFNIHKISIPYKLLNNRDMMIKEYLGEIGSKTKLLIEENYFGLDDYVKCILEADDVKKVTVDNIGEKIYKIFT